MRRITRTKEASPSIPPGPMTDPESSSAGKALALSRAACLAGAILALACGDAGQLPDASDAGPDGGPVMAMATGATTTDATGATMTDAIRLQDSGGSPMMDASRGDTRMPQTTTSPDAGAMASGDAGREAGGGDVLVPDNTPVSKEEMLAVFARLKAVPAGVIYLSGDPAGEIWVSSMNVWIGRKCPNVTPVGWDGVNYGPLASYGWGTFGASKTWILEARTLLVGTVLTDTEVSAMNLARTPLRTRNHPDPRRDTLFTPITLSDWIRQNRANLDEAIANTLPDPRIRCP